MTVNWTSLGCVQKNTFESIILDIVQHFYHFLIIYKPGNKLIYCENNQQISQNKKYSQVAALVVSGNIFV